MKQPSNDVLLEKIENLNETVKGGFKGVHDRQDIANNNVAKNTEHRIKFESNLGTMKWIISISGIGYIALFLKTFL